MPEEKKVTEIPTLESLHYYLLSKEIDESSAEDLMKFILERNFMNPKPTDIRLIINSPGGDVCSALAIIDVMEASSVPIKTYGLGQISSAGFFIFMAGQKGHRYITKNTSIMSHQYTSFAVGKEHDLFASRKDFDLTSKRLLEHCKKHTGLSKTDIEEYLLPPSDVYLTAQEAKKLGCADKIMKSF